MSVSEADLVLPTLSILSRRLGGFITTEELIAELKGVFDPSGRDVEILSDRADTYMSQKVRNLVSHRHSLVLPRSAFGGMAGVVRKHFPQLLIAEAVEKVGWADDFPVRL